MSETAPTPKYRGTPVVLGDNQTYIVPPLPLGELRRLREKIMLCQQGPPEGETFFSEAQLDAMQDVFRTAVLRNYPSEDIDALSDLLTMDNAKHVLNAIFRVSGLEPVKAAQGEAE